MKKVISFLLSLVIFCGMVVSVDWGLKNGFRSKDMPALNYELNKVKFRNYELINSSLDENTVLVLGSSELSSQKDTKFHPRQLMQGQQTQMMLVGAGYYQSLEHTIELAACSNALSSRKVALIISPQWFVKGGVDPTAFASNFSEKNFIGFLKNDQLSKELKTKICTRVLELLDQGNPAQASRIRMYIEYYVYDKANLFDRLYASVYSDYLELKGNYTAWKTFRNVQPGTLTDSLKPLDWNTLLDEARTYGREQCTNNPFFVYDEYYDRYMKDALESKKNSQLDGSYTISSEFDDLSLFLEVCRELDITSLVISIPVKGVWYDYIGFPKTDRDAYYQKIRTMVEASGNQLADFSDEEYSDYFLSDIMHLGWEGWVKVSESIVEYAESNS